MGSRYWTFTVWFWPANDIFTICYDLYRHVQGLKQKKIRFFDELQKLPVRINKVAQIRSVLWIRVPPPRQWMTIHRLSGQRRGKHWVIVFALCAIYPIGTELIPDQFCLMRRSVGMPVDASVSLLNAQLFPVALCMPRRKTRSSSVMASHSFGFGEWN